MSEIDAIQDNDVDPVVITTTVPIPLDLLKRSFKEDIMFEIDVDNSKLPANRIINYVSNVSVKHQLLISSTETMGKVLVAYMSTNLLYPEPELEALAMIVVIRSMGGDISFDGYTNEVLDEYVTMIESDILDLWRIRLSCLKAWALYVHTPTKELALEYPVDDRTMVDGRVRLDGINFIHVLASPLMDVFTPFIREEDIMFNEELFTGYIFSGKNMFSYCGGPDNPYLLALYDFYNPTDEVSDVSSS